MSKPPKSFRLDPHLLAQAEKAGLNLTFLFEAAIAKAIKDKKCPYCGSHLKKPATR